MAFQHKASSNHQGGLNCVICRRTRVRTVVFKARNWNSAVFIKSQQFESQDENVTTSTVLTERYTNNPIDTPLHPSSNTPHTNVEA